MTWELSRSRTGGLSEVGSQEDMLATLDYHHCIYRTPLCLKDSSAIPNTRVAG
jgi:hypothetical protein